MTKAPVDGQLRLLDSATLAGPIPSVMVREVVTNALTRRDLSDLSRGTSVQVNVFLDRLEVLSPGGLHGAVTLDRLGEYGVSPARSQQRVSSVGRRASPSGQPHAAGQLTE
ncbi:MAG: hypothetical protein FWD74_01280 [Actinomycetia bacterium]|nr:hypothetical protein [Actinomycetes bacterium]